MQTGRPGMGRPIFLFRNKSKLAAHAELIREQFADREEWSTLVATPIGQQDRLRFP
jgi:hypothetical protein